MPVYRAIYHVYACFVSIITTEMYNKTLFYFTTQICSIYALFSSLVDWSQIKIWNGLTIELYKINWMKKHVLAYCNMNL